MARLVSRTPVPTPVYLDHVSPDGTVVYLGRAESDRDAVRKARQFADRAAIPTTEIKFSTEGETS